MEIVRAIEAEPKIPRYTYAELVDVYGEPVYKLCRSLTYSREDADDLFQETFFKAFEQLAKIHASDNPQGFLLSSCVFIWKGWKRKYARRKRLVPVEPLDENIESSAAMNMEEHVIVQEEIRIVRELVEGLPEKFKIPIILHYTLELGVTEIAQSLNLPVGTVKSRLFKARKLVEKGLVENHYEK